MQTFLPFSNYERTFRCLDNKRLGNQVYNECLVLLSGGWPHHPASRMWRGHFHELCNYALCGLDELASRGFHYRQHRDDIMNIQCELDDTGKPSWMGYEPFHASHRSNLLLKNPRWYGKFGWSERPGLPYVWPTPDPLPFSKRRKNYEKVVQEN